MNKYLLVSALFGFAFNSFVFGANKLPDMLPLGKCRIELNDKVYYPTGNLVGGEKALGDPLNNLNVVAFGLGNGTIVGELLKKYEFKEGKKGKECKSLLENICSYITEISVEVSEDIYTFKLVPGLCTLFEVYDGLEYIVSNDSDLEFKEEDVGGKKWYSASDLYDGVNTESVFGWINS